MSPFLKKQVLPRVAGLPVLVIGYWLGGTEGVVRAAGLMIAAGCAFMIYIMWRRASGIPRTPRLVLSIGFIGIMAAGLAMVGPLAPWLIDNAQHH